MSETKLWQRVRKNLAPYGQLHRIENSLKAGTPDAVYCLRGVTGWIELKHSPAWPARPTTVVKPKKFTREQAVFLLDWTRVEGFAFLLWQIGHDTLLFDGRDVELVYAGLPAADLIRVAIVHSRHGFPIKAVLECLTTRH